VCLELLHQRFVLETDDDDLAERDETRAMWLGYREKLGVSDDLLPAENMLLERACGTLDDDALDDLHGRATGALVLLWALGRLPARPSFADVEELDARLADSGLLGDGSVARAKAAVDAASLRPVEELARARAAYEKARGKAREVDDPNRVYAEVAAHQLAWIEDEDVSFDDE
jgi:hypothetical protein